MLLFLVVGSCKKEILVTNEKSIYDRPNIDSKVITYTDFLNTINNNSLGFLKSKLNNTNPKTNLISIADTNAATNLSIYADSVQKIIDKDGISYIFRMALSSKRAISFNNLTIFVNKAGKTSAFIATYTPTKEWVAARNQKKETDFIGAIQFTPLKLESINLTQALSKNGTAKIMGAGSTIKYTMRICETYTVYTWGPYPCSSGVHMPGENCDFFKLPNKGTPPGIGWRPELRTDCYDVEIPDSGAGNGGVGTGPSGGGSAPTPPPGYNPCGGGVSSVADIKIDRTTNISVAQSPPGCDPIVPPVVVPIEPVSVILGGPFDYEAIDVDITSNDGPSALVSSDYQINGINNYFTELEFNNIIENLSNDFNDDPIQFYMIACYKNSKLLNSSTYSTSSTLQVGEYTLTPHYNSQNTLVFYSALRKPSLGIEFLIKASTLNAFKTNYIVYRAAGNLFYVSGKPSYATIQMAAGDYWEGLLNSWKDALRDPMYYVYLGHIYIGTTTNLKSTPTSATNPSPTPRIKYSIATEPNSRYPSINIDNMSIAEFKDAISVKYGKSWIPEPGDATRSRLLVDGKLYFQHPSSTVSKPTIDYTRNGKLIGKFRFKN